jgi:hypothetical protein
MDPRIYGVKTRIGLYLGPISAHDANVRFLTVEMLPKGYFHFSFSFILNRVKDNWPENAIGVRNQRYHVTSAGYIAK